MIKLVVFDMDDTLVHTHTDYESIRNQVKKYFQDRGFNQDFVFKPILAKINQAADLLTQDLKDQDKLIREAVEIINSGEVKSVSKSSLIKGARQTLSCLKERNLRTSIFSRTCKEAVIANLEKFHLTGFAIILGRDDTKEPKPNPEGLLSIMSRLGVTNKETLMVGDHVFDMDAGKSAGTINIGVLTGGTDKEELISHGANYIIESIEKFPFLYESIILNNSNSSL